MSASDFAPAEGRCTCGNIRYRMTKPPMIVHGCHCTWCQRESGSAFGWNAMVETDCVEVQIGDAGDVEVIDTPSHSGKGQKIARCPKCRVALWSHYAGAGESVRFMRVGTLDEPGRFPPDIHIYTSTKAPWVVLPEGVRAVPDYYRVKEVWPAESLARFLATRGK